MNNTLKEHVEGIKQKVNFFFINSLPVHINFTQGYFQNGIIKEVLGHSFTIEEFKDGEVICFFLDVKDISKYKEVEK
jgi:hypothetical protein